MKHLSTYNLLSNCQYGFRKGWSTGDLAFLTESWSSFLGTSVKPLLSALTYRKPSIVWHKSLISKLLSYGFYPSLCTFISSFLFDHSIATVADDPCSSKTINSGYSGFCSIANSFSIIHQWNPESDSMSYPPLLPTLRSRSQVGSPSIFPGVTKTSKYQTWSILNSKMFSGYT